MWISAACLLTGMLLLGTGAGQRVLAADYVVAVEGINYLPLYDGSDMQHYGGFARELLDLFASRYGHHFRYVPLPINRLFSEVYRARKYDFKFPDNPHWQPEIKVGSGVVYSDAVVTMTEGLFVPAGRLGKQKKPVKYIAMIAGFTPTPYLDLVKRGKIVVYPTNNFESLFKMRTVERVDGIYANPFAVKYFQSHKVAPADRLVLDTSMPMITSAYALSSIRHPDVIAQFNQFLRTDQSSIARLKARYGIVGDASLQ